MFCKPHEHPLLEGSRTMDSILRQVGRANFYVDVTIIGERGTHNSQISINCYTRNDKKCAIACKYKWFRIQDDRSYQMNNVTSNTYQLTANDIGFTIKAEVSSEEEGCLGESYISYGPIILEQATRSALEFILSTGETKFPITFFDPLTGKERSFAISDTGSCSMLINPEHVEVVLDSRDKSLKFPYTFDSPSIETSSNDVQRATITFATKTQYKTNWEELLVNQRIGLRFISRTARDLFLLTLRSFAAKNYLLNSHIFDRILTLNQLNAAPKSASTPQGMPLNLMAIEIGNLKKELKYFVDKVASLRGERESLKNNVKRLEEELDQTIVTYQKILSGRETNEIRQSPKPSIFGKMSAYETSPAPITESIDKLNQITKKSPSAFDSPGTKNLVATLKDENSRLKKQVEELLLQVSLKPVVDVAALSALQAENKQLKEAGLELEDWKRRVAELEDELEKVHLDNTGSIREVKQELKNAKVELVHLRTINTAFESETEYLKSLLATKNNELTERQAQYEEALSQLEKEKEKLLKAVRTKNGELQDQKKSNDLVVSDVVEHKSPLEELERQLQGTRQEAYDLSLERAELLNALLAKDAMLNDITQEIFAIEEKARSSISTTLNSTIDTFNPKGEAHVTTAHETVGGKDEDAFFFDCKESPELKQKEPMGQFRDKSLQNINACLVKLKEERDLLNKEVEKLHIDFTATSAHLEVETAKTSRQEEKITSLEAERMTLLETLSKMTAEADSKITLLDKQLSSLELDKLENLTKIDEYERQVTKLHEVNTHLVSENKILANDLEHFRNLSATQGDEISKLEGQLAEAGTTQSQLMEQLQREKNKMCDLLNQNLNLEGKLKEDMNKIHDLEEVVHNLEQETKTLGVKITHLETQLHESSLQLEQQKHIAAATLEAKLEELRQEEEKTVQLHNAGLEELLKQHEKQLLAKDVEIKNTIEKFADIENIVNSQGAEILSLKEDIKAKECRIIEINAEKDKLTAELGELALSREEKLGAKEEELSKAVECVTELENTVEALRIEVQGLKEDLSSKESIIATLNDEKTKLATELNEVTEGQVSRLLAKDEEVRAAHNQLADVQKTLESYETELASAKEDIRAKVRLIAEINSDREKLTADLKELESKSQEKDEEIGKISMRRVELENRLSSLESEIRHLNEDLKEKENKIALMVDEKEKLEIEMKDVKGNEQGAASAYQDQLKQLTDDFERSQAELVKLRETVALKDQTLQDSENQILELNLKIKDLEALLVSLQDEIVNLKANNESLRLQLTETVGTNQMALLSFKKEKEQLEDLEIQRAEAIERNSGEWQRKIDVLQEERQHLKETNANLLERLEANQSLAGTQQKQTFELKSINKALEDQISELNREIALKDELISDLTSQVHQMKQETDSLRSQLPEVQQIAEELRLRLREEKQESFDQGEERIIADQKRIAELELEISDLKEHHKTLLLDKEKRAEILEKELQNALVKSKEELEMRQAEWAQNALKVEQVIAELEQAKGELTKELEAMKAENIAMASKLETAEKYVVELGAEKDGISARFAKEIQTLKTGVQEREHENLLLHEQIKVLEQDKAAIHVVKEDFERQIATFASDLATKTTELEDLRKGCADLVSKNCSLETQVQALSASNAALKSSEEAIVTERDKQIKDLEEENNVLAKKVNDLENVQAGSVETVTKLEATLKVLELEKEDREKLFKEYRESLDDLEDQVAKKTQENTELMKKLLEMDASINLLCSQQEKSGEDVLELKSRLETKENELHSVMDNLADARKVIITLREELESERKKAEELTARFVAEEGERKALLGKVEEQKKRATEDGIIIENLMKSNQKLVAENSEVMNQVRKNGMPGMLESENAALKDRIKEMEQEMIRLSEELEDVTLEKDELVVKMSKMMK